MIIFIDGHDIASLKIGFMEKFSVPLVFVAEPKELVAESGEWLRFIEEEIGRMNLKKEEISGVAIVSGPGSPTALRASLALGQTLALTLGKDLYRLETNEAGELKGEKIDHGFILPIYNRSANISVSNKDSLRRPV